MFVKRKVFKYYFKSNQK